MSVVETNEVKKGAIEAYGTREEELLGKLDQILESLAELQEQQLEIIEKLANLTLENNEGFRIFRTDE